MTSGTAGGAVGSAVELMKLSDGRLFWNSIMFRFTAKAEAEFEHNPPQSRSTAETRQDPD